jgi:hypothetical protein
MKSMTTSWPIKRSEKLPRGSYFYLQVGYRYYAGEEAVFEEVKEAEATINGHRKGETARSRWGGYSWSPTPRKLLKKWARSGKPKYMDGSNDPYRRAHKTETRVMATNASKPILTDDLTKVKQFRRKKQADDACKRLIAMYGSLDVKVSVRLKEGV